MISGKQVLYILFLLLSGSCFAQNDTSDHDSILVTQIESKGVFDDDFIRKTFYTWTTAEQINELRTTKKLLVKSRSDDGGSSLFDIALRDTVFKGMPVIQLLKQPQFARKRYAWVNCWSTCMGMEEEKYGDQLVKMELKDDAIIGKLDMQNMSDPIEFFNLKGDTLTCNYAIENQDKIAVIFHVNTMKVKRTEEIFRYYGSIAHPTGRTKRTSADIAFREFVIINEKMITWSYGTDDIKKEISSEIDFLRKLQSEKKAAQLAYTHDCELFSRYYTYNDDVECAFNSNKCFNIDYYLLNKKSLQKIIDTLEQDLKLQSSPITN